MMAHRRQIKTKSSAFDSRRTNVMVILLEQSLTANRPE